jgi:murein DD-endopeptidase MepM/ murein hydrolase activator NlpD
MRWIRISVHLLIALLVLVPFYQFLETESEASSTIPMGLRPGLLLTTPAPTPALDKLAKLDRLVIAQYTMRSNEDIWSLCRRFGLKDYATTIRSSNGLDELPTAGTVIKIPNHIGTLFNVQTAQPLKEVTTGFEIGRKGGEAYTRQVLAMNDYPLLDVKDSTPWVKPGTQIFLPNAYKPTGLPFPFRDMHFRVTSGFGNRRHPVLGVTRAHRGMDLARPFGDPVYPSRSGVVTFAGWQGGYGNMIEIRHVMGNGHIRYTRYGHLSKILVHEGQKVGMGKLIGRVGSTGISTGPHLHFEVRDENGTARNPQRSL